MRTTTTTLGLLRGFAACCFLTTLSLPARADDPPADGGAVDAAAAGQTADATAAGNPVDILGARWSAWFGGKDEVSFLEIEDLVAREGIRGAEAATVAALYETAHQKHKSKKVDSFRAGDFAQGAEDAEALRRNFRDAMRKVNAMPRELWADGAPHPSAVTQSGDRTGDCWLMAPTGWMVRFRPEVVRRSIEEGPDGTFRVTMPGRVSVEVRRPTDAEVVVVNAMPSLEDGLWLPVLKDAIGAEERRMNPRRSEIEANTLRIIGGSPTRMIEFWSGHEVESVHLGGRTPAPRVREILERALERRAMIGVSTGAHPGAKIPPDHACMVFGFDGSREVVTVWNPYNDDFTPKGPPGRENGYPRVKGVLEVPLRDFVDIYETLEIETDRPLGAPHGREPRRREPERRE